MQGTQTARDLLLEGTPVAPKRTARDLLLTGEDEGPSAGTYAASVAKAVLRGPIKSTGVAISGVSRLLGALLPSDPLLERTNLPPQSALFAQPGRELAELGPRLFPPEAGMAQAGTVGKFLGETLPEAASSFAPYVAVSAVAGPLAAAGAMGAGMAESGFYDAKAHGADDETAWKSYAANFTLGAGGGVILNRLNAVTGGLMKRVLVDGAILGTTNAALTTAANLAAQKLYDHERDILEGVPQSAIEGTLLGGFLGALRMAPRASEPKQAPEVKPTPEAAVAPPGMPTEATAAVEPPVKAAPTAENLAPAPEPPLLAGGNKQPPPPGVTPYEGKANIPPPAAEGVTGKAIGPVVETAQPPQEPPKPPEAPAGKPLEAVQSGPEAVKAVQPPAEPPAAVSIPVESGEPAFSFSVPDETLFQATRRKFEDYFVRAGTIQSSIRKAGGEITPEANVVNRQDAYRARVAARVDKARLTIARQIRSALRSNKIDLPEVEGPDGYLYGLHGPKRNETMAERHPQKFADGGSGMTTAEAQAIQAKFEADPRAEGFKRVRDLNREINAQRLRLLQESGLLSEEGAALWKEKFGEDYVPLKTVKDPLEEAFFGQRGFSVKGEESKRAEGRESRAGNLLTENLAQLEQTIERAERNRVGQSLGELARTFPNKDLWEFVVGETAEGDIFAKERPPKVESGQTVFSWKEKGYPIHLVVKDPIFGRTLSRIGIEQAPKYLRAVSQVMSVYRHMNTVWSPEFIVSNLERDIGTAGINIQEFGKGWARKMIASIPKAESAIIRESIHPGEAKGEFAQFYREGLEDGAFFGIQKHLSIEMRQQQLTGALKGGRIGDAFRLLGDIVETGNKAVESGTRLAAYKLAREKGITREQAAHMSRNLTGPWQKHGELGPAIGAGYMFFSAGVTGPARMLRALNPKNPGSARVWKAVGALSAAVYFNTLAQHAIMGQDDKGNNNADTVPKHEWYDSIVLGWPGSDKHFTWRVPYGYRVFTQIAASAALMRLGKLKAEEAGADTATGIFESFNPLGQSGSVLEMLTPTLFDPAARQYTNKDWHGGPIKPQYPNDKRPESEKAFRGVNPSVQKFARWLNRVSGGDRVEEGKVSVSPEVMEMWAEFLGGGIGKFIKRTMGVTDKLARGESVTFNEIPGVRVFLSEKSPRYEEAAFAKTTREIEDVKAKIEAHKKVAMNPSLSEEERVSSRKRALELRQQNPTLFPTLDSNGEVTDGGLIAKARGAKSVLERLRDRADRLEPGSEKRIALEKAMLNIMQTFNAKAKEAQR